MNKSKQKLIEEIKNLLRNYPFFETQTKNKIMKPILSLSADKLEKIKTSILKANSLHMDELKDAENKLKSLSEKLDNISLDLEKTKTNLQIKKIQK